MSEKFNVLQGAMASSERIFQLLDTPVEIASGFGIGTRDSNDGPHRRIPIADPSPGRRSPSRTSPSRTSEASRVLRDVSFEVEPGQRVAIVGATGSGKTTIVSLLLRFYDVQEGRITIDGVDIREMDLHDLRALFGLVLQDVHLFSGTIGGNVRLGNDAIRRRSGAARGRRPCMPARFIDRLPDGLETPVAERGATLSVGQKQLLSFARALAFDPPVLVLDEATSSVDTETELLIRDALKVVMRGRTTIAIAHRLSTIQDMDRILVLHKGELRESGTHQELLAQRGIYHRLYQLQFKDKELVNSR